MRQQLVHASNLRTKVTHARALGSRSNGTRGNLSQGDVQVRVIHDHDRYRVRNPRQGEVYVDTGGDIDLIAEATVNIISEAEPRTMGRR